MKLFIKDLLGLDKYIRGIKGKMNENVATRLDSKSSDHQTRLQDQSNKQMK